MLLLVLVGLVLIEVTGVTRFARTFLRPAPPAATPHVDMGGGPEAQPQPSRFEPVDLLALVGPARDSSVEGQWQFKEGMLLSPPSGKPWLQIPYTPPDQYDLVVTAQRNTGNRSLRLGLVIGGRQCYAQIDEWPLAGTTVSSLMDFDAWKHSPVRHPPAMRPGKPVTLVCQVRKVAYDHTLRVTCDGEELFKWAGQAGLPSETGDWVPAQKAVLFLGSHDSVFQIGRLEVIPISASGQRRFTDGEAATADRVAAERMLWKGGHVWVATGEGPPAEIDHMDRLPRLFQLARIDARAIRQFSNAYLAHLRDLRSLTQVSLLDTQITHAGLANVRALPGLDQCIRRH